MKTIIHDLNENDLKKIKFDSKDKILPALKCKNNCIGCFSCWIKHPKKCIFNDDFSNITDFLKDSEELVIISKNRYGCYSGKVKKVLERCIGYVLPYFEIRNNEIHHQKRYDKNIKLNFYFYGNNSNKELTEKLVKANSINLGTTNYNITYINNIKELNKCIH